VIRRLRHDVAVELYLLDGRLEEKLYAHIAKLSDAAESAEDVCDRDPRSLRPHARAELETSLVDHLNLQYLV
jgi:hypothetical protein